MKQLKWMTTKMFDGKWGTFLTISLFAIIFNLFLSFTIHNRSYDEYSKYKGIWSPGLYHFVEDGFFSNYGLLYFPRDPARVGNEGAYYYTSSAGFMYSSYFVHKISQIFSGGYSPSLRMIHNQILLMVTSILFSFLAFRLASRFDFLSKEFSLLLALSCYSLFQSSPSILVSYWELWAAICALPFVFLFFILDDLKKDFSDSSKLGKVINRSIPITIFLLVYVDRLTGVFTIVAFLMTKFILDREGLKKYALIKQLIVPIIFATVIFKFQVILAALLSPEIGNSGASTVARAGLDGDSRYLWDHWSLFEHRRLSQIYKRGVKDVITWKFLFSYGVFSLFVILSSFYIKFKNICEQAKGPAIILLTTFLAYMFISFIFPQSTVIHADLMDALILYPIYLAGFMFVPNVLEKLTGNKGLFVWLLFIGSIAYTFVNLRVFSLAFPL